MSALVRPLSATVPASPRVRVPGFGAPGGGRFGGGGFGGGFRRLANDAAKTILVHLNAPVTVGVIVLAVLLAVAGGLIAGIVRRLAGRAAAACRRPRANPVMGTTHPVAPPHRPGP